MTTQVVNIYATGCDVYIGRGRGKHMNNTKPGEKGWLGNPYSLDNYGRETAIEMFRRDFHERLRSDQQFLNAVLELRGKRLGCFCKPQSCHGDVIVEFLGMGKPA